MSKYPKPTTAPWIFLFLVFGLLNSARAQPTPEVGEEGDLYAATKQVNQFFRRFNAEETVVGDRLYEGDYQFRDPQLRKRYLESLFDDQNPYLTPEMRQSFIRDVTRRGRPLFLDFHGGDWFAEVGVLLNFRGQTQSATLFLKLQEQPVGSKWVIDGAYIERYQQWFRVDSLPTDSFLHPMSHELNFMNLGKAFGQDGQIRPYASRDFRPDHLSLLMADLRRGEVRFQGVNSVKFHFLQIDDWYFEISEFERTGFNKGWLISKLTQIPNDKKPILIQYIYNNYQ